MDSLEQWKGVWSLADTDLKRVKALCILTMFIKRTDTTEDQRRDIYETIGYSFLKRLLLSEQHESPGDLFKTVSLTILSCFCTDSQVLANRNMCNFVEPINKILTENMVSSGNKTLVLEGLNCLLGMVSQEKCREKMIAHNTFAILANIYCHGSFGQEQAIDALLRLISHDEVHFTFQNQGIFNTLLAKMSDQFFSDHSLKKFEFCEQILIIILKCPLFSLEVETANKIRETLAVILRNKLIKEHRDMAIKLSSLLIDKMGSSWFAADFENARTFFLLLVQLSCIEIRMLIEDRSIHDIIGESFLLTACYTIFEYVISIMVTEGWFQSNRNFAEQLLNSIKMAMTAALEFVKGVASECKSITFNVQELSSSEQILLATIRVICSWLAEETFALQEKVYEVLPFILNICKEWFQQTQLSETPLELDPLRFLMSPLCHLTVDSKSREILLNHGLLSLLLKYFEHNWKIFETDQGFGEIEVALTTMCSIFLNIVVLDSHLSANSEDFFTLLKLLLNGLPNIASHPEHLVFKANLSVLGLLLTKHCHKKVKSCETSFYRFLSASVKFLWDAHYVETQEVSLCITRRYREVWADIMELWFLGVQALCSLLPVMPWIANFIAESGWPTVIINALSRVSSTGVDGNIKSTYQALLSTLVRISDDVAEALVQQDGIAACKKHQLTELERLLSSFNNRKSS